MQPLNMLFAYSKAALVVYYFINFMPKQYYTIVYELISVKKISKFFALTYGCSNFAEQTKTNYNTIYDDSKRNP